MQIRDKLYIAGQWVSPSGRETIDVHNAGNGEVMGRIPAAAAADADAAARAARAAFEGWAGTPAAIRADYLQKIADGLKARSEELARTIAQEVGMPLKLAGRIQVGLPIANFANYAKLVRDFKWEDRVGNSMVVREPVGVVAAITPWNYPLHQITLKLAPALGAGCTVVLKPSEVAPFNAFILAEVIEAAGLPKGVFNLVTGYGPQVGEALVKHPDVDMISFTGSTRAGKRISELAAQGVKRVALELGGKSASVILDDADLPTAVKSTVNGCYLNSGQTCTALTRMLVPAGKYEEAAKLAAEVAKGFTVGDPLAETTRLGRSRRRRSSSACAATLRKAWPRARSWWRVAPSPPRARPRAAITCARQCSEKCATTWRSRRKRSSGRCSPSLRTRTRKKRCASPMTRCMASRARYGRRTRAAPSASRGASAPGRSTSTAVPST